MLTEQKLAVRLQDCGSPVMLWHVCERKMLRLQVPFQGRAMPRSRHAASPSLGQIRAALLSESLREGCTSQQAFPVPLALQSAFQHLLYPLSSPSSSHQFAVPTACPWLSLLPHAQAGVQNKPAALRVRMEDMHSYGKSGCPSSSLFQPLK